MPNRDGTGPNGKGPMTGRGQGQRKNSFQEKGLRKNQNQGFGKGFKQRLRIGRKS